MQQDEGAATPSPGSACNQAAVARRFNQGFGESYAGSHQQGLHHWRIVTHINLQSFSRYFSLYDSLRSFVWAPKKTYFAKTAVQTLFAFAGHVM